MTNKLVIIRELNNGLIKTKQKSYFEIQTEEVTIQLNLIKKVR